MADRASPTRPTRRLARGLAPRAGEAGLTLVELVVAFSLMLILSTMALPVARVKVQREKERRLRAALVEIRTAIDRFKDMADEGRLGELDPDNHGYPDSLEVLVDGVPLGETPGRGSLGIPAAGGIGGAQGGLGQLRGSGQPGALGQPGGFGQQGAGTLSQSGFGSRGTGGDPNRQGLGGELGEDPSARNGGPETLRFLRAIPVDPMTGRREWGLLSVSDNPEGRSWSGRNVFDVYSLSTGIALDGSTYSEW